MTYSIPFNRPCLAGNEYKYIAQAIANGTPPAMAVHAPLSMDCLRGNWASPKLF